MTKVARYLIYSQLSFFGFSAACFVLAPAAVLGNLGLSYYGNDKLTIVPYGLGLLLTCYFMIKAARALSHLPQAPHLLVEALEILGLLIVGVLLTPYSLAHLVDWLHTVASTLLFALELAIAAFLLLRAGRDWLDFVLMALQLGGGVLALLSLMNVVELMLTGQIIVQGAFGVLLIRGVERLVTGKFEVAKHQSD